MSGRQWKIAARAILRRPGFAASVILILALGIGANTALFSLVNAVLWSPLPFPNADRMVTVYEANSAKSSKQSLIAPARLVDWNRLNHSFAAISASYAENVTETSGSEPERIAARRVAPRFFDVFQMTPLLGRTFTAEEDVDGGPAAAVISEALWTRRFARDRNVLGRGLAISGRSYTIVGVMPKEFAASGVDLWMPSQINSWLLQQRDARFYNGVGRLIPGITIEQARADLDRVQHSLAEQFPKTDKGWSVLVGDLKEYRVGTYRRDLLMIFGAVAALLLIAIANIAGLMIGQLNQRERELAIRSSLGASRGQVVGALMREVILVTTTGAVFGALLGLWGTQLLARLFADLPRMTEMKYDWRAMLFASVIGLFAALLFGIPPALQATRGDVAALISRTGRAIAGGHHQWQRVLLVAQVAVTVLLLSSAGLLLRSYHNLSHVDAGFNAQRAVTFHVGAAWDENRASVGRLQEGLIASLERFPGVESAGFANFLPVSSATLRYEVVVNGLSRSEDSGKLLAGERTVTSGYLKALQVPLIAGEWCATVPQDSKVPPKVMVNRRFAELYAGGANLVGHHLRFATDSGGMEISGIVADVHEDSMGASAFPYVYACLPAGAWPDPEYVVRTKGDAVALMHAIPGIVHELDPKRAVFGLKTLDGVVNESLDQPRLSAQMLTLFAGAAMLLASVGLYGLITMLVAARTREIGVRMALGARPSQILGSVFSSAGRLLAIGATVGLALTMLGAKLLQSMVFGVSAFDMLTFGAAVLALALVCAIATYLPARRAAAIEPIEAMRAE